MKKRLLSRSPEETARAAADVARAMSGGEIVALSGDLGAGKTTFVQAFAKALGVTKRVQSPTFILLQEYPLSGRGSLKKLVHADAYRADEAQFEAIGFSEYAGRPDTIVVVEWAERIQKLLPKKTIKIRLSHQGGDIRKIVIED